MTLPIVKLKEDRTAITFTFRLTPSVTVNLDVLGVEELLRNIGEMRSRMIPPRLFSDPRGKKVEKAVVNPSWAAEPEIMQGNALLHLMDPRFGQLTYMLPRPEAARLGRLLVAIAEQPSDVPPSSTN